MEAKRVDRPLANQTTEALHRCQAGSLAELLELWEFNVLTSPVPSPPVLTIDCLPWVIALP